MRELELIIYRNIEDGKILKDMVWLMENYEKDEVDYSEMRALCYGLIHSFLEMAGHYGFSGNLWHCYLTHMLVNNENSYSKACEIRGQMEGTVNIAVLHDIKIIKEFFRLLNIFLKYLF